MNLIKLFCRDNSKDKKEDEHQPGWEEQSKTFFNKKNRDEMEFEWKLWGNSIHPSVYLPHFYPDYYDSFEEWVSAMEMCSYSIPTLSRLRKEGLID